VPFVERSLAFYRDNHYPALERRVLTVLARIYAGLGEFERSRVAYNELLTSLRTAKDEAGMALATEQLAGVLMDMGRLPDAFAALRESLDLNRRAGNQATLTFTLSREAELLARLGRLAEAQDRVNAIQAELAAGREAYVARAASLHLTQARVACARSDWRQASSSAATSARLATADQLSVRLGAAMASALAAANLGRRQEAIDEAKTALKRVQEVKDARLVLSIRDAAPSIFERAGDLTAAHQAADAALAIVEKIPNIEASWRLQALASVTASALNAPDAQAHRLAARKYSEALQKEWGPDAFAAYSSRPDIRQLRKRLGL
jgi:tetratricopeptide (TPR) repeat protein